MGYTLEEMRSGSRMIEIAGAVLRPQQIPPMIWSRHGPLPVLFDLPFLALSQPRISAEFLLSLQSPLLTAGLLTILFVWLRKIAGVGMALLITLVGAFGTMLWPYAYIGLEPKQSFFLLLAGYLALRGQILRGWWMLLGFALACGLAISVKSTGIVLFPPIAYLVYVQFREDWRSRKAQLSVVMAVIGLIWLGGAVTRQFYWGPAGGGVGGIDALRPWIIDYPTVFFTNLIGLFGSPSKGLFVYAPVLLLVLYAIPKALREHPGLTVFALLVTGASAVELCLLVAFADELWGSRYMHCAIAPLLLVIGAANPRFAWRRHVPLLALALIGAGISFLGVMFHYSVVEKASAEAGQNIQEWLVSDAVWNPPRFHARLFGVWLRRDREPVFWTPSHHWLWVPPPGFPGWKPINLRPFAVAQPGLLRLLRTAKSGPEWRLFLFYLAALLFGAATLGAAVQGARLQAEPQPKAGTKPASKKTVRR